MIAVTEMILNENNFDAEVLHSKMPVLVDFSAQWCGPCRMLAPVMSEIAEEYDGRIKVCTVNVEKAPNLAARFRIDGIPAVLAFKNGKNVDSSVGYTTKENILALLG